jgi:hypothetical protein
MIDQELQNLAYEIMEEKKKRKPKMRTILGMAPFIGRDSKGVSAAEIGGLGGVTVTAQTAASGMMGEDFHDDAEAGYEKWQKASRHQKLKFVSSHRTDITKYLEDNGIKTRLETTRMYNKDLIPYGVKNQPLAKLFNDWIEKELSEAFQAKQSRLFDVCKMLSEDMSIEQSLKVLNLQGKEATPEGIKKAYREAAMLAHPDRGGSEELMKQVNAAYEKLKGGSFGGNRNEFWEKAKQERIENGKKIRAYLKSKLDLDVFLKHLQQFDPSFSLVTTWIPKDDGIDSHSYGVNAIFKTEDGTKRFALELTIDPSEIKSAGLGDGSTTFNMFVRTQGYVDGKTYKFGQSNYSFTSNEQALLDPEVLFPTKKIKRFFGGARKDSKFAKRDAYAFLSSELDARLSGDFVYIPLSEDKVFTMYRSVIQRNAGWILNGVYEGKYVNKQLKRIKGTMLEELAPFQQLKEIILSARKHQNWDQLEADVKEADKIIKW